MPRLSIDITPEEHQKLKAIAALKGESIKDYVLKRTLGDAPALDDMSEDEAVPLWPTFSALGSSRRSVGSFPRSRWPTFGVKHTSRPDCSRRHAVL